MLNDRINVSSIIPRSPLKLFSFTKSERNGNRASHNSIVCDDGSNSMWWIKKTIFKNNSLSSESNNNVFLEQ